MCHKCEGNNIKTEPGNSTNCDVDPPCNGITTEPNHNHTACGTHD